MRKKKSKYCMWRKLLAAWIATSECFSSIWIKKNLKISWSVPKILIGKIMMA